MIKRLLIIAFITGFGHLITILSLKFITTYVSSKTISSIAQIDTFILFLVSIISFGLQLSSMRKLVLLTDWKEEFYSTQSARFTLSLIFMLIGLSGIFITHFFLFLLSPIIALNADYALYGLGKPLVGALVAFTRILIPSIGLILGLLLSPDNLVLIFSISIVIAYLCTGVIVSKVLNVSYFVTPKLSNLIKYYHNLNIGFGGLFLFFVGIGIINVMSYFYSNKTIEVAYIGLKLYMIFKGIGRIIVQAFIKELIHKKIALEVDYFSIITGVVFLFVILFYNEILIHIIFADKFIVYKFTFIILGVAGFLSSFSRSSGSRLLLKKEDKYYSINLIISGIFTIGLGLLFRAFIGDYPILIVLCVLFGELSISALNIHCLNEKRYLLDRFLISYPIILFAILFFGISFFLGQSILSLLISLTLFSMTTLIFTRKVLKFV